jgi:hypothetical protein
MIIVPYENSPEKVYFDLLHRLFQKKTSGTALEPVAVNDLVKLECIYSKYSVVTHSVDHR